MASAIQLDVDDNSNSPARPELTLFVWYVILVFYVCFYCPVIHYSIGRVQTGVFSLFTATQEKERPLAQREDWDSYPLCIHVDADARTYFSQLDIGRSIAWWVYGPWSVYFVGIIFSLVQTKAIVCVRLGERKYNIECNGNSRHDTWRKYNFHKEFPFSFLVNMGGSENACSKTVACFPSHECSFQPRAYLLNIVP